MTPEEQAKVRAAVEKALRCITYPVSTEIRPDGFGVRPEKDIRYGVSLLRAILPLLDRTAADAPGSGQDRAGAQPAGCGRESFRSCGEWADETFGPASVLRRLQRAEEELHEAKQATHSTIMEEIADVVICLAAAAHSAGGDLQAAIDRKMAINRARQWSVRGDGTGYHIPAAPSAEEPGHE